MLGTWPLAPYAMRVRRLGGHMFFHGEVGHHHQWTRSSLCHPSAWLADRLVGRRAGSEFVRCGPEWIRTYYPLDRVEYISYGCTCASCGLSACARGLHVDRDSRGLRLEFSLCLPVCGVRMTHTCTCIMAPAGHAARMSARAQPGSRACDAHATSPAGLRSARSDLRNIPKTQARASVAAGAACSAGAR